MQRRKEHVVAVNLGSPQLTWEIDLPYPEGLGPADFLQDGDHTLIANQSTYTAKAGDMVVTFGPTTYKVRWLRAGTKLFGQIHIGVAQNSVQERLFAGIDDVARDSYERITSGANAILRVATPLISPPGGSYTAAQSVTITTATPNAVVYYTTDGTAPTTSSPVYSGPLTVDQSMVINAYATLPGYIPSFIASASFAIDATQAPSPVFSILGGTYGVPQSLALSAPVQGGVVRYTTDGTTPTTASPIYSTPIAVGVNMVVRALTTAAGLQPSAVVSHSYQIRAATPVMSPTGGSYSSAQTVVISTSSFGASVRYTTDGSTPTQSSPLYTGAVVVASSQTLKAAAFHAQMADSLIETQSYTIAVSQVAAPQFSIPGGSYNQPQTVGLSSATAGASIFYTTDGSTPTAASTPYTAPIQVVATSTLRAIATASGLIDSAISTATYTINAGNQAAAPSISVAAGAGSNDVVTITAQAGATIYYTLDGTTPTISSTLYNPGAKPNVSVQGTIISAVASAPGFLLSDVAAMQYFSTVPPTVFSF